MSKPLLIAIPSCDRFEGLIQASIVQLSIAVVGAPVKDTKSLTPSKLKAWPTLPGAKVAPLTVPLFRL